MADGPALALQKGLISRLRNTGAGLAPLVGARIYDEPPATVTLPYVRLGNFDVEPFRTDVSAAWDVAFSIEVHSRPVAGRVEATRITEAIVAALDEQPDAIAVAGFILSWILFETFAVARDADGRSYVATIAFRAVLDV